MKIEKETVIFEKQDMNFVNKFGFEEAANMVIDFKSANNIPFIYDTDQLSYFLGTRPKELFKIIRRPKNYYFEKSIPKKSGGFRNLSIPCCILRYMQRIIYEEILSKLPVSKYARSYIPHGRIYENASPHTNKKYLLKIDITDFFSSISFEQVSAAAFNTKYFPKFIGFALTTLCTKNECLPQGAPTSPALSNLVMKNFDDVIGAYCEKRNISYTRYCDDLTFSADFPLYHIYEKVENMLSQNGFEINGRKTKFITNASRQSVTGLTVNEKVTVSKDYKRNLRQEIYFALKFGISDAITFADRKEYVKDGKILSEKYKNHLIGKVRYVLCIEPENQAFRELLLNLKKV